MSTAAQLYFPYQGKIITTEVHSDGYYSYMGVMLATNYTDPEKVMKLFNRGHIISVQRRIEPNPDEAQKIYRVKHPKVVGSLLYIIDVTYTNEDIGINDVMSPAIEIIPYDSQKVTIKEIVAKYADECSYVYDINTRSWYTKKNHKDKKIIKCEADVTGEFNRKYNFVNKVNSYISSGNYEMFKWEVETLLPVKIHKSRSKKTPRFYLTYGSDSFHARGAFSDKSLHENSNQKICYCNNLQEVWHNAVAFALTLV